MKARRKVLSHSSHKGRDWLGRRLLPGHIENDATSHMIFLLQAAFTFDIDAQGASVQRV
jgi:hypothetical protein